MCESKSQTWRPYAVQRETDFMLKRVVVLRLHDTAARFRTRMKFSLRYSDRGEPVMTRSGMTFSGGIM